MQSGTPSSRLRRGNRAAHRALANILYLRTATMQKEAITSPISTWFRHHSVQYPALLREEPLAGSVCAEFALLLRERGDCLYHLGYEPECADAYEAAACLWISLAEQFPHRDDYLFHHAETHYLVATRKSARVRQNDVVALCLLADRTLTPLLARDPDHADYARLYAQVHRLLGSVDQKSHRDVAAIAHYEKARVGLHNLYYLQRGTNYDTNLLASYAPPSGRITHFDRRYGNRDPPLSACSRLVEQDASREKHFVGERTGVGSDDKELG